MPQDLFQTAKVSKFLMAINKGQGSKYVGKSLDEISFSDNAESDSDEETAVSDVREGNEEILESTRPISVSETLTAPPPNSGKINSSVLRKK